MVRAHLLIAAAAVLLTGCTADASAGEVTDAAARFASASPEAACGLLAPDTLDRFERDHGDCPAAIRQLALPDDADPLDVAVAGESALARLPGQVLFLARFPQGWLITAAGCSRDPQTDPAVPYECEVAP